MLTAGERRRVQAQLVLYFSSRTPVCSACLVLDLEMTSVEILVLHLLVPSFIPSFFLHRFALLASQWRA